MCNFPFVRGGPVNQSEYLIKRLGHFLLAIPATTGPGLVPKADADADTDTSADADTDTDTQIVC